MKKQLKKIPKFTSEKEEREFWQDADSTEYVTYASLQPARFPNLQLSTKPITIRLPVGMIERFKVRANKMDIPYQALIKMYLHRALYKSDKDISISSI